VLNFGVRLHEDGVNDTKICNGDSKSEFLCVKFVFVGVMNEYFTQTRRDTIDIFGLSLRNICFEHGELMWV
jgi:hypothetical protein